MKAEIEDNIYGKWLNIIPENRKELLTLRKLWSNSNITIKKIGCCIHASGITQHGINNSSFSMSFNQAKQKEKEDADRDS